MKSLIAMAIAMLVFKTIPFALMPPTGLKPLFNGGEYSDLLMFVASLMGEILLCVILLRLVLLFRASATEENSSRESQGI